jgi:hypothetical protein
MLRSRAMIGGSSWPRAGFVLLCAVILTGCASAVTLRVPFPFDVGERRLTQRAQPFSLWNYDYTRIPSIMEQCASTYQALFLRSMQLEGVFPDDQTVRVVQLRHTDAEWQPDLSDLPAVCRQEDPPLDSFTAVVERIAELSTRFWLASECDRQLLAVAAAKVVAQNQPEILTFLEGHGAGGVAQ